MGTTTNYLLANMAASDVVSILLSSISFLAFGTEMGCKLTALVEISTTVSSIYCYSASGGEISRSFETFRTGLRLKEGSIAKAIVFI